MDDKNSDSDNNDQLPGTPSGPSLSVTVLIIKNN